jgi:putative PEP-CTERM system TPR-repeat lipoprotein
LAQAYEQIGDGRNAGQELEKVLELDPDHVAAKFDKAKLLARTGQVESAESLLQDLKEAYPDNPSIAELEGKIALAQNRPQEAIALFQKVLETRQNNYLTIQLASAQWRTGEQEAGYTTLQEWLEKYPQDLLTRNVLANAYLTNNQLDQARQEYTAIVRLAPDNVRARNNLAWLLLKSGSVDEALPHARHAHQLAPEDPQVLDTLGAILLEKGQTKEALPLLRRAAERLPEDLNAQYHLAKAFARNGRNAEAQEVLDRLLAADQPFQEREKAQALLKELGG